MAPLIDLTGQKIGYFTVLSRIAEIRPVRWLCRCDCGTEKAVRSQDLRTGHIRSCGGCRLIPRGGRIFHGLSSSDEFKIWRGMINRCHNPNVKNFCSYGGKGIVVCEEWRKSFTAFLADVGERPSKAHSIDRINPSGNYEPGNCRWALALEQGNNKRNTRRIIYRGEEMSLCEAVRLAGSVIHHEAAAVRIRSGWTVERAVETPRLHESGRAIAKRRRAGGYNSVSPSNR